MNKKHFKYRKTVIVSSFIFVLGFFTINILHFDSYRLIFQEKLFESFLPSSAEYITAYIEQFNSKYLLLSEVLASEFDPYQYYSEGKEDPEAVISRLKTVKEETGVKTAGYISFLTDTYYDSSGTVLELDYSSGRDRWITDFLDADEKIKSTFYDPEGNDQLFAIYNDVKIYDSEGKITGLFGLGISFDSATDSIEKIGKNKKVYFADSSAVFVFPSNVRGKSLYEIYGIDRNLYTLSVSETKQYEKIIYLEEYDRSVVLYSEYISLLDKFIVIELDITEIYSDIENQFLLSFFAGLLLSAAIIATNIYIINYSDRRHFKREFYDPLTGTYNRRYLDQCFSERFSIFTKGETSLITFDIDFFKEINDSKGHLEGDEILKTVSRISLSHIRDDDAVVRWGGDEFILLVNSDIDGACGIAERIRSEVLSQTGVSISAGVTFIRKDDKFKLAMERADSALYKAKEDGRNRVYTNI